MMAGLQVHLKAGCLVVLMEFLTVVMRVGQMAHLKVGYWEAMNSEHPVQNLRRPKKLAGTLAAIWSLE